MRSTAARKAILLDLVDDRADLPERDRSEILHGQSRADAGPTAAGILIATVGEAWCFLLDAARLSGGHRLAARDGGQALVASGEKRVGLLLRPWAKA